jgi:SAM-dependent methyltransferase
MSNISEGPKNIDNIATRVRKAVLRPPWARELALHGLQFARRLQFPGSADYWERRYARGGTSGAGSYGAYAEFKAEIINDFVTENVIGSIIEFGCGDGNQLSLTKYEKYIGLDVSKSALTRCAKTFADDSSKSFFLYDSKCFVDRQGVFRAELGLSLEVIFHLIEDDVFDAYMRHLFASASRFVCIFSSDTDARLTEAPEERDRKFSSWIEANALEWQLVKKVPHKHPWDPVTRTGSVSDFYFYASGDQLATVTT